MLVILLIFLVTLLFSYVFYKWATVNNDYFEGRNIKYEKPTILIGNNGGVFFNKYTAHEFSKKLYQTFPDEPIYGTFEFRTPQYIIRDPELIKQIAVKDFDHFENHRGFGESFFDELWSNSLFIMKGEKWRQMRATLSPAFTGSKMRHMFDLVAECASDFVGHFLKQLENQQNISIEVKDTVSRYTNDVIATCAFGLKINSLANPNNEFYTNGKKLMDFSSFKAVIKMLFIIQCPSIARLFNITFTDQKVTKKFRDTILDTMEIRKQKNIVRPDMINIMMEIREGTLKHQTDEKTVENDGFATVEESSVGKATVNRKWNDEEIVAQCFSFFIGGFETSSTLLTFAAYELAVNSDVQQKLFEEISEVNQRLGQKRLGYDDLQKMKYLDQVICETLRKWPALSLIDRACVKDYVLNYKDKIDVKIEKGSFLLFQLHGIQNDPKYFPDPEKFDPERFSDEQKNNITPGTYFSFGIGPRNCIGSRFALMQIKALLYYLLLNFSFEPNETTQIPMKLMKSAFNMLPEKGVHLDLKPRSN